MKIDLLAGGKCVFNIQVLCLNSVLGMTGTMTEEDRHQGIVDHLTEDDAVLQEGVDLLHDAPVDRRQEEIDHHQEEIDHRREEIDHRREEIDHPREEIDPRHQEGTGLLQEEICLLQEEICLLQEDPEAVINLYYFLLGTQDYLAFIHLLESLLFIQLYHGESDGD